MANYKKFDVLIIGLGNIGFRHLQALINTKYDINYHLVEILDENITRCKTYLLENDVNTFNFYKDINSIDVEKLNLVISATCANIRLKLLKNLFDNKSIKSIENIVLEKIIFTEKNEFGLFEEMIESRVSLDNVYCSSDWDNRFKFKYLEEKYNVSKGKIHIHGSWSLGCNSIHAIMMLLKYFEFNNLKTNNIQITQSKRNNYKEINGKLSSENIIIESQDSKEFSLNFDICVDNYLIFATCKNGEIIFDIKQEKGPHIYKNVESFTISEQYLSNHYKNQYQNILYNKENTLIDYKTTKKGHCILIDSLQPYFENEKLPIT